MSRKVKKNDERFACVRFTLYGVSPRAFKRGDFHPDYFTKSLFDCTLQCALDVMVAYCRANNWEIVTHSCYRYGERFRL